MTTTRWRPASKRQESVAQSPPGAKTDETIVTLKPNEGVEYKMTMVRGAVVQYSWTSNGGNVNYDLHGSPKGGGKETSYKKGREVASNSGTLTAAYDGSHGWFWRNRGSRDVTITLKTSGAYTESNETTKSALAMGDSFRSTVYFGRLGAGWLRATGRFRMRTSGRAARCYRALWSRINDA